MLRRTLIATTIVLSVLPNYLYAEAYEGLAASYEQANSAYTSQDFTRAARLYGIAADQGHVEAQFKLGFMYAFGVGVDRDKVLAHKLFNLAATQGHDRARYNRFLIAYGMNSAEIAEAQRQAKEAFEQTSSAAPSVARTLEDASAAYQRQDYGEAVTIFQTLAERGVAAAQYSLGQMYQAGEGIPQNYVEAARWLDRAADQGHVEAQFNLGFMYAFGVGVDRDKVLAHKLFNLAATQGHDRAGYNRFLIAYRMTSAEIAEAQRQAKDAFEQTSSAVPSVARTLEDASAAYQRKDYGEAVTIFQTLAERGVVAAQYSLGQMYRAGEGIPQNYVEAARWLDRAADQGHVEAQFNLGFMYAFGVGVDRDKVLAHKLFNLAATQGHDRAGYNRFLIANGMTSAEISEAQRQAEEWLSKR